MKAFSVIWFLTPFTLINSIATAEIPLFHVMTASVTFGNVNGHTNPAPHISLHMEQGRVEPVAVTTPTRDCQWREYGVTRRGRSLSQDEEGGRGEEERGSGEDIPTATGLGPTATGLVPSVI